ncbi:hypothetical protein VPHD148_0286 [Vibrio phage D148]
MYSPLHTVTFIRDLMRQMFYEYGGPDLSWNEDPRKSKVMIGTINDNNTEERIQQFPRVLIQRGPTFLQSQFISNNLNNVTGGVGVSSGDKEIYRQDVNGSITILIEARNEGTCEEIGELLRRFLCWSKPFIETQFGFQAFGKQINLSQCDMDREDAEKFKININIPYIIEDKWQKTGDLVRLNHVFQRLMGNQDPTIVR